jgi:glutamine amidotransferase
VIAIVDYGAGNLTSVARAFAAIGAPAVVTRSPRTVLDADAVVVPGVGHFGATAAIGSELRACLRICAGTKPLLGICLGMQFLFDGSDEAPDLSGLGMIEGRCALLRPPPPAKVPHVGWNTLDRTGPSRLLTDVEESAAFYFTHSYAAPINDACVARASDGQPFAAIVEAGFMSGVQFHPEKSGTHGLQLLRNFVQCCVSA